MLIRQIRAYSSPWSSSPRFAAGIVLLAVASGIFAAYVQDNWPGWHSIGHSLVLWIVVALVAGIRGTWLQSCLTSAGALFAAVISYFVSVRIFGPYEYPAILNPLLLFWILLSIVAGVGFAAICLTSVNSTPLSWLAIGTGAGLLLGDSINASAGIPYIEQKNPLSALLSIAVNPDPVIILGVGAAVSWTIAMVTLHRHRLDRLWLIIPGIGVGYLLVTIPDILLHYI